MPRNTRPNTPRPPCSRHTSRPIPPPPAAPPPCAGGWRSQLLSLVNNARAQAGLPALCFNTKLARAAQAHSQDQANHHQMTHTGSDGSTTGTRATRAGYAWSSM